LPEGRVAKTVTVWTHYRHGDVSWHNRERLEFAAGTALHIGVGYTTGDVVPGGAHALITIVNKNVIPRDLLHVVFGEMIVSVAFKSPSSPSLALTVNGAPVVAALYEPQASTSRAWRDTGRLVFRLDNAAERRVMQITADVTEHVDGYLTTQQLSSDEVLFRELFVAPVFAKDTNYAKVLASTLEWCVENGSGGRSAVERKWVLEQYLVTAKGGSFTDRRSTQGYIRSVSTWLFKAIRSARGDGAASTGLDPATWTRYDAVLREKGLAAIGSGAGEEFDAGTDGRRTYYARNDPLSLLRIAETLLSTKLVTRDDWTGRLPRGATR
jgi:hypothetical protein